MKTIEGELQAEGVRAQKRKLRESVKRVDPVGRRLRRVGLHINFCFIVTLFQLI